MLITLLTFDYQLFTIIKFIIIITLNNIINISKIWRMRQ